MSGHKAQAERTFTVQLAVTIRRCRRDDLAALEWFGRFAEHREIIRRTFAAQEEGSQVMLVADAGGAPVGQVWIDLARKRAERTGVVWAVRVFPWLRSHGIGAQLMGAAEAVLRRHAYTHAELGVERDNPRARRFYERLGYRPAGTMQETYSYTTPEGTDRTVPVDEWVLRKAL